ncbi:glycoside hydrolase [Portibacter lacus]|uniref:Xylanase n=1 Tax=Portibacter lacus TaxID=1099794 RepID=A0AA37WDG8_9BACT|nr:glycoside hydrolase [Portibacter lacus]GLR17861.1 xylanase [Portibacter lacus]
MKQIILILSFLIPTLLFSQDQKLTIKINTDNVFQEIHSFGASDSWRTQFVGKNWPQEKKQRIANLLFSLEEKSDGSPVGIGLSNWRFYLGAGSMEQGDQADIRNVWRRSECFLDADGNYDWSKYEGQRWFLQEAKKLGVPMFTLYTISPPVFYTKNGIAHATKGDLGFNLKEEHYDNFSNYIVTVLDHFKQKEKIEFKYISPFNEPQWAWDKSNQEGSPATNAELFKITKNLSEALSKTTLSTKILAGEAGQMDYLYRERGKNSNGDQVNVFFNRESPFYMGNFKNLEYAITSHSYFTTWPIAKQISVRQKLAERIKEINPELDFHQTEFCILEKNPEITGGRGRDLGMPTALYVARVIHSDLTIANAKSWEWWTALSQFDYKDGLIHLDDGIGNGVRNDTSALNHQLMFAGTVTETKLLWAFGNFSRFVRPGMKRIEATLDHNLSLEEAATDLQVVAFKDFEKGKAVIVFINYTEESKAINLEGVKSINGDLYITDDGRDLKKTSVKLDNLSLPKRSVSTLIIKK